MLNEWNNIQQSLLHINLSFSFWGFLICDIRRDCRKNRLKVRFRNVGKYHHCLISNGSGTEKPSFWRNCRRNKRKGKKLLHDKIMLSVLWLIYYSWKDYFTVIAKRRIDDTPGNKRGRLVGRMHMARGKAPRHSREAVSRQKCGWELIWNARCSEKGEKLGENA